ncbi:MAG: ammonia-dependent NAD(+) synthetase [Rothia sp. (in: high G+C Gram-positive bacteria)]|uniref:ammonia-dependent NAD(+) synthetase n=1 Tax=Rothia sp. (in: high G+C Gram-positive bacteria) TaxID=1885016 RepID=UPI0026DEC8C6|nr:ammonia-dependent NAD(+) synthetase [Rothia sp. (in: high G+C Gram-positive bacteria)]MDO5750495.1 ammonia-dependent NAD(+) synthetase [Rothia sp. (in: high G+C Gram-positive bacteria)]
MRELQAQIVQEMGVKPSMTGEQAQQEISSRVAFLADYIRATGTRGLVLGISGGIDSTLAGRLCQLAVEQLRETGYDARFIAVRLPYKVQADEADAQQALDFIQPDRAVTFNIADAVQGFDEEYTRALGESMTDFNKGNVKARARMIAQYAIGGDYRMLVVGTDHAAESITGFFTKFGDGGADVLPLAGLNKRQNQLLLQILGASERLWAKVPTADLLDGTPGRKDEDELGISYTQIDDYLEGKEIDPAVADKLEAIYLRSRHKRALPVTPADSWWK